MDVLFFSLKIVTRTEVRRKFYPSYVLKTLLIKNREIRIINPKMNQKILSKQKISSELTVKNMETLKK